MDLAGLILDLLAVLVEFLAQKKARKPNGLGLV